MDLAVHTGLASLDLSVLARLILQGPMCIKELVAELGVPRSTMTALAGRLEKRGLVLREDNPGDRRSVVLEATEASRALLVEANSRFSRTASAILKTLSRDDQEALLDLLRRVRERI